MRKHDCILSRYELTIRQQPKQARMVGGIGIAGQADRRPIDPPPIVQLKVIEHPHGDDAAAAHSDAPFLRHPRALQSANAAEAAAAAPFVNHQFMQNPYYFMYASLVKGDGTDEDLHPMQSSKTCHTVGSVVSSLYHLKDLDGSDAAFFTFPDISLRFEGSYKLKFTLFEIVGREVYYCNSILSDVFIVYNGRDYPGVQESTQLSRAFANQGHKIRVRSDIKIKRRKTPYPQLEALQQGTQGRLPPSRMPSLVTSSRQSYPPGQRQSGGVGGYDPRWNARPSTQESRMSHGSSSGGQLRTPSTLSSGESGYPHPRASYGVGAAGSGQSRMGVESLALSPLFVEGSHPARGQQQVTGYPGLLRSPRTLHENPPAPRMNPVASSQSTYQAVQREADGVAGLNPQQSSAESGPRRNQQGVPKQPAALTRRSKYCAIPSTSRIQPPQLSPRPVRPTTIRERPAQSRTPHARPPPRSNRSITWSAPLPDEVSLTPVGRARSSSVKDTSEYPNRLVDVNWHAPYPASDPSDRRFSAVNGSTLALPSINRSPPAETRYSPGQPTIVTTPTKMQIRHLMA